MRFSRVVSTRGKEKGAEEEKKKRRRGRRERVVTGFDSVTTTTPSLSLLRVEQIISRSVSKS